MENKRAAITLTAVFAGAVLVGFLLKIGLTGGSADLREWLSALSGWVAVVAAGLTIFVLQEQLAHQRRQTDFVVGDELPSVDAVQDFEEHWEVVVLITNWNRRNALVESSMIVSPQTQTWIWKIELNDEHIAHGQPPNFDPPKQLRGWVDRSKPPNRLKIRLHAMGSDGHILENLPRPVQVDVRYRLIGLDGELNSRVDVLTSE